MKSTKTILEIILFAIAIESYSNPVGVNNLIFIP